MAKRERVIELNQSWAGPYGVESVPLGLRQDRTEMMQLDMDEGTCTTGVVDPDPKADLYAAIPWAKEAGLELVEVENTYGYGTWLYVTKTHWFCFDPRFDHKWYQLNGGHRGMYGYYPTREAALKSPPTMPPGYVAAKPEAKPSLLDELAEAHYLAVAPGVYGSDNTPPWHSLKPHQKEHYCRVALAVARRLLEREASRVELEAMEACITNLAVDFNRAVDNAAKASRRAQLAEVEGK